MHLAFLTSEYPHPRVTRAAGIATSIKNLVSGLVTHEVSVSLFVYGQKEDAIFNEDGITFHLIKNRKYKILGWYLHRKHIERYVNNQIVATEIDAIEAPDWTGITAFMNFKAPLVIRFHGSDTYFCKLEGRKQKSKNRFFEKNAVAKASAYIAPTTYAGVESAKLFGIPKERVKIIHYGLNLEHFVNEAPSDFIRYRILNIGTVIRKKGVFQLAKAFNQIVERFPQAELVLIGGDASDLKTGASSTWELVEESLSKLARKRTSYLGRVPYETVKDHIKQAHVCAFPSLAETLGMVTIESMALKKAVVNTNYGWAQELMDHNESGFLIDPNDIEGYVTAISDLFKDETRTLLMGELARKKMENTFDIKSILQQNIAFYTQLIEQ